MANILIVDDNASEIVLNLAMGGVRSAQGQNVRGTFFPSTPMKLGAQKQFIIVEASLSWNCNFRETL